MSSEVKHIPVWELSGYEPQNLSVLGIWTVKLDDAPSCPKNIGMRHHEFSTSSFSHPKSHLISLKLSATTGYRALQERLPNALSDRSPAVISVTEGSGRAA